LNAVKTLPGRNTRTPFDTYLSEINRTPLLSVAEERALAAQVAIGDSAARDRMVRANLRLVVNLARGYTGRGLPLEDLIAEGNMGLLRAVEGYDAGMSTRFSTYAAYWIKQSMRRALHMSARTVRLPAYVIGLVGEWRRAAAAFQEKHDRVAEDSELAELLGLSQKQVRVVKKALRAYVANSLGEQEDGSDISADTLADTRITQPDDKLSGTEELGLALDGIHLLDNRAAEVLRMRFGLDGNEPRTLQEIGDFLGYTRERVRQIEREALAKLREHLQAA
jgi:RNA polymerase primary sigma factor